MLVSTARASGVDLPIVIRPHPVDSQESWRRWIHARRALAVRLDDMPLEAAIPDTARAVGISSMLLTEMRLCGVTVASMQPRNADLSYYCLPFEALGIARIADATELGAWFAKTFEATPASTAVAHVDSVTVAARLIRQMARPVTDSVA